MQIIDTKWQSNYLLIELAAEENEEETMKIRLHEDDCNLIMKMVTDRAAQKVKEKIKRRHQG